MSDHEPDECVEVCLRYPFTGLTVPMAHVATLEASGSSEAFLRGLAAALLSLAVELEDAAAVLVSAPPSDM